MSMVLWDYSFQAVTESKYILFQPSIKHVKIQHLCTITPQTLSKKNCCYKRLIKLPFYHTLLLPLLELYRSFTLEITPQLLIHMSPMLCAKNPCQGPLRKYWCFHSPNFLGGPLPNCETNLNLTLSSGFILWPCTADPMNKTLSSLCSLSNWTFSGSADLYNKLSTPICVHNAPMPARNGCNIDAFQCRSHHSQSGIQ